MRILTLIIKQKFFNEIISGEKKQEFREIRPNTQNKYCEVDSEGYVLEDENGVVPKKYDAIQFYVGYNKDRDSALVEIKSAKVELFVDEETNEFVTYEHNGEDFIQAQIVYDLGEVIERKK